MNAETIDQEPTTPVGASLMAFRSLRAGQPHERAEQRTNPSLGQMRRDLGALPR
jgi:hypothetical protein